MIRRDLPRGVGLADERDGLALVVETERGGLFDDGAVSQRLADTGVGDRRGRGAGREEGDGGQRGEDGDGADDGFQFHRIADGRTES